MNNRQYKEEERTENGNIFVGYNSNPPAIAGAIAGMIRGGRQKICLKTASNLGVVKTVKAVILAQSFLNDPNFPGNKGRVRLSLMVFKDKRKTNGTIFVVHPRYLQEQEK